MARYDQTVNIQQQNLSSGAAQSLESQASGLMGLSSKFAQMSQEASARRKAKIIEEQTLKGQQEFTKGVQPEFKDEDRLLGGTSAKAYNRGLAAAYTSSLKADSLSAINDIQNRAGTDLAQFDSLMTAEVNSIISTIDPVVVPAMRGFLDGQVSSSRLKVQDAHFKEQRDLSIYTAKKSVTDLTDMASRSAKDGDLVSSANIMVGVFDEIDGMVDAGFVPAAQSQPLKRAAELQIVQSNIIGKLTRDIQSGNTVDAMKTLSKLHTGTMVGMTTEEQKSIFDSSLSNINTMLSLENKLDSEMDIATSDAQEAKTQSLYLQVLDNQTDANDIKMAISTNQISLDQGEKLINIVNNRGTGVDDYDLIIDIENMISDGKPQSAIANVIMANSGTRLTQSTARDLIDHSVESNQSSSVLNTEKYKTFKGYLNDMLAVKSQFGFADTESSKRIALAERELRQRVLEGEDVELVVDELIPRSEIKKLDNSIRSSFGAYNVEDKKQFREVLNERLRLGTIQDSDYDYQIGRLDRLEEMQQAFDSFMSSRELK